MRMAPVVVVAAPRMSLSVLRVPAQRVSHIVAAEAEASASPAGVRPPKLTKEESWKIAVDRQTSGEVRRKPLNRNPL